MYSRNAEVHRSHRSGWLRAAVLGANDGLISVAGLVVGVAASGADRHAVVVAGLAGLVAGALSMAAGEYVSVQSQADTEDADLLVERRELDEQPHDELDELTLIYVRRGLTPPLARQVAEQLTAHDDLAAHARDELGITTTLRAKPLQAALASASAFIAGALAPLLAALLAPGCSIGMTTVAATVACLFVSGALAALAGGAAIARGAWRVGITGVLAMAASHGVGVLFGAAV